jgi:ketosteroid isomerase-like protein
MPFQTAIGLASALIAMGAAELATKDAVELKAGFVAERPIGMSEVHRYSAHLNQGQMLRVSVDQRGIDLVLKLYGPDGSKLRELDAPTGAQGPERLSFLADTGGSYRIDVATFPYQPSGTTGRYEIRVVDLRAATPQERTAAATEKILAGREREWDDAVRTRDTNALGRIMSDDFISLPALGGGATATKEQILKMYADLIAREKDSTFSHELTDTAIHIVGDTALANGRSTITRKMPHGESKQAGRYIHAWQKRGGEWRLVADHWDPAGRLPPPAKVVPVSRLLLDGHAGRYDLWPGSVLTVTTTGDGLTFKNETWGWTETYLPASSTEFFGQVDGNSRALFIRNDAGRVSEVILLFDGQATRAPKIEP